jgi:hypothetical protein
MVRTGAGKAPARNNRQIVCILSCKTAVDLGAPAGNAFIDHGAE